MFDFCWHAAWCITEPWLLHILGGNSQNCEVVANQLRVFSGFSKRGNSFIPYSYSPKVSDPKKSDLQSMFESCHLLFQAGFAERDCSEELEKRGDTVQKHRQFPKPKIWFDWVFPKSGIASTANTVCISSNSPMQPIPEMQITIIKKIARNQSVCCCFPLT